MRRRLSLSVILILCISMLCSACGKKGNFDLFPDTETEQTATQYKLSLIKPSAYRSVNGLSLEPGSSISIIGRYENDSYWKEVERGAQKAIEELNEELGYKGKEKITVSLRAPKSPNNINEQINLLDEELNRFPDALAIAPVDASACKIQFQFAAENQIPILTFDTGSEYKYIAAHISTDYTAASNNAASQMATAIEKNGEIAIFAQDSCSASSKTIIDSFLASLEEEYPDVSVVHIYYMDQLEQMSKDPSLAEDLTQENAIKYILHQYPNLKGIFTITTDATELVLQIMKKEAITNLKLIAFDGNSKQLELVEDGSIEGFIMQNPFGIGYATVVASIRAALGIGNDSVISTGYEWVSKNSLKKEDIQNMLY